MKCLTLIMHESIKQELIDMFRQMKEVTGYTFIHGEGHSSDTDHNPFETNRDRVMGYVPRVRVDLILADEDVENVMLRLQGCDSCLAGLGVWWISPVDQWGQL
jgi:nitrogen regulatory protein P-II 1